VVEGHSDSVVLLARWFLSAIHQYPLYCSLEKIEVAGPIVSLPLNFGKNNAAGDVITCFQVESRGLVNNY
jgi:hypothetical protein